MQKIMIVEDDPALREELALLLENEGYTPLAITEFTDVPGQAAQEGPDLILLDIGLPGKDGFSLCAALRKAISAPVIFVTSRDAGVDIDDNTLSVNMTRLRGKLAAIGLPGAVKTRRGMGYQL